MTAHLGRNKVSSCHSQSLQPATANHSKGNMSMREGLNTSLIHTNEIPKRPKHSLKLQSDIGVNFSTCVMTKVIMMVNRLLRTVITVSMHMCKS